MAGVAAKHLLDVAIVAISLTHLARACPRRRGRGINAGGGANAAQVNVDDLRIFGCLFSFCCQLLLVTCIDK